MPNGLGGRGEGRGEGERGRGVREIEEGLRVK